MTVAIEVAEVTLTVVTRQIDLAPVVLAETYHGLDRISHRCRHFYGCGALIQIWLAGHLEMYILCPQRHAIEIYYDSGHAKTIKSVPEEYEKLSKLTDGAVTWRITPFAAEPFSLLWHPRYATGRTARIHWGCGVPPYPGHMAIRLLIVHLC